MTPTARILALSLCLAGCAPALRFPGDWDASPDASEARTDASRADATDSARDARSDVADAYMDVVERFLGADKPLRFIDAEKPGFFKRLFGGK